MMFRLELLITHRHFRVSAVKTNWDMKTFNGLWMSIRIQEAGTSERANFLQHMLPGDKYLTVKVKDFLWAHILAVSQTVVLMFVLGILSCDF